MKILQKLIARHRELKAKLVADIDAMHADGVDESRRTELSARVDQRTTDLDSLETEIEKVRRANSFKDYEVIVREGAVIGAGADGPEGQPNERNLRQRRELLDRAVRAGTTEVLTDEEKVLAMRRYDGEELHLRRIAEVAFRGQRGTALTEEQHARHDEYLAIQTRAVADGYTPGAANLGMEYVPEVLDARIRLQQSDRMRPLATDEMVSVTRSPNLEKRNIPTMNRGEFAAPRVPATDRDASNPATGEVSLNPIQYDKLFAFDAAMWLGPVTDLETKIVEAAGASFGGALNMDRTRGAGTAANPDRITGVTVGAATRPVATAGAIAEGDITGLLGLLPEAYHMQAGTRIMFNRATELALYSLRAGAGAGFPVFDRDPMTNKLVMPLGFEYAVNSACQALGAANRVVAIVGDFGQYEVLTVLGGMRFATDYEIISDQFLIGMSLHTDGKPAFTEAFKVLIDKA